MKVCLSGTVETQWLINENTPSSLEPEKKEVWYLDLGNGHMRMGTCQNSSSCMPIRIGWEDWILKKLFSKTDIGEYSCYLLTSFQMLYKKPGRNEGKLLISQRTFQLHLGPLGSRHQQNHLGQEGQWYGNFMLNGFHFSFRSKWLWIFF